MLASQPSSPSSSSPPPGKGSPPVGEGYLGIYRRKKDTQARDEHEEKIRTMGAHVMRLLQARTLVPALDEAGRSKLAGRLLRSGLLLKPEEVVDRHLLDRLISLQGISPSVADPARLAAEEKAVCEALGVPVVEDAEDELQAPPGQQGALNDECDEQQKRQEEGDGGDTLRDRGDNDGDTGNNGKGKSSAAAAGKHRTSAQSPVLGNTTEAWGVMTCKQCGEKIHITQIDFHSCVSLGETLEIAAAVESAAEEPASGGGDGGDGGSAANSPASGTRKSSPLVPDSRKKAGKTHQGGGGEAEQQQGGGGSGKNRGSGGPSGGGEVIAFADYMTLANSPSSTRSRASRGSPITGATATTSTIAGRAAVLDDDDDDDDDDENEEDEEDKEAVGAVASAHPATGDDAAALRLQVAFLRGMVRRRDSHIAALTSGGGLTTFRPIGGAGNGTSAAAEAPPLTPPTTTDTNLRPEWPSTQAKSATRLRGSSFDGHGGRAGAGGKRLEGKRDDDGEEEDDDVPDDEAARTLLLQQNSRRRSSGKGHGGHGDPGGADRTKGRRGLRVKRKRRILSDARAAYRKEGFEDVISLILDQALAMRLDVSDPVMVVDKFVRRALICSNMQRPRDELLVEWCDEIIASYELDD